MRANSEARSAHPLYVKSIPFVLMHLAPLGMLWSGVRWVDVALCVGLYYARMFFITGAYHRYFAHRSYKMGRVMQFLMALGGTTAAQKGPLWWAANHRHHHRHSDDLQDIHSPKDGFWWSHVGWIMTGKYDETDWALIPDFAKFPELRLLNTSHLVPPILLGTAVWALFGWSGLFCGFFLSTVLLYHGTFFVNSLAHVFGTRRFATTDTSRNSLTIALITLGEGWHNNHHHFQGTANQGFYWYEIDITYAILVMLSWFGLTRDLRRPTADILAKNRIDNGVPDLAILADQHEREAARARRAA